MLSFRWVTLSVLSLVAGTVAMSAEFPTVDQLPSQPGLPDPLKMLDGTPVTTAEQWRTKRRPELVRLFRHYMYGVAPEPPGITATVTRTVDSVLDGQARLKEIEIRFQGLPDNAPRLHLALFVPKNAKGKLPVFLGIN